MKRRNGLFLSNSITTIRKIGRDIASLPIF